MLNNGFTRRWYQYTLYNITSIQSWPIPGVASFALWPRTLLCDVSALLAAARRLIFYIILSYFLITSLKISFAFPIITRSFKNPHGLSMYIILSDWSIWIILSVRMQYHRGHYQLHHQQLREPADLQRQVLIRARFNTCSRLGEGQQCWMLDVWVQQGRKTGNIAFHYYSYGRSQDFQASCQGFQSLAVMMSFPAES